MSGPTIDRSASSGDIWTPQNFRAAVVDRFGAPMWDLAASQASTFAPNFYSEISNAFAHNWHEAGGLCWLNPPYSNIAPWARKCAVEHKLGAEILLLVPFSGGANWFWDHVFPWATVYSVGRMTFDNCFDRVTGALVTTPYAKDLILAHYNPAALFGAGLKRWLWKPPTPRKRRSNYKLAK